MVTITQSDVEKITRAMVAGSGIRCGFYEIIRAGADEADRPIYRLWFELVDGAMLTVEVDMNSAEPVRDQVSRRIDELKAQLLKAESNPT